MGLLMEDDNFILRTENALLYERKIWFVEYECNELYFFDLKTEEVVFVCKIVDEIEYQQRLVGAIVINNGCLYLIPFSACKIYEINLTSYKIRGINIVEPENDKFSDYNVSAKMMSAHVYNEYIYIVGASYPGILAYNCKTDEIIYYNQWVNEILQGKKFTDNAFFRKSILVGTKIYAPSCMANLVLEFDVETKCSQIYEVGSSECSYSSICQVEDVFWLSPRRGGPFVKWDCKRKQWWEYKNYPQDYVPCDTSFADIIYWNHFIYAIPMYAEMIIRIDKASGDMEAYADKKVTHLQVCVDDELLYCFDHKRGTYFKINLDGDCEEKKLRMPIERQEYHRRTLSRAYKILSGKCQRGKDEVLYESHQGLLGDFISYIIM